MAARAQTAGRRAPAPKGRSPAQWQEHNLSIVQESARYRDQSSKLRAQSARQTHDTLTALQRTQRDVQNKLTLRIDDIETRRMELERQIDATTMETDSLDRHKHRLQRELDALTQPLDITHSCMDTRNGRTGVDQVDDQVDDSLAQEEELIMQVRATYQAKIEDCVEQLRKLRAANFQLNEDLRDKFQAHDIDRTCRELDETSRLELFEDSVALDGGVMVADWEGYTHTNIDVAIKEIETSEMLREEIDGILKTTKDALTQQANVVEHAFNTRIAELTDAKHLAEESLVKTQEEIRSQEQAVRELELTIESRQAPLKVARTRLERRAKRPNVELVHDPAHQSLVREVQEIQAAIEDLQATLATAEDTLRSLNRAELSLQHDVETKTGSLNLDNRCMQLRQQFKYRQV